MSGIRSGHNPSCGSLYLSCSPNRLMLPFTYSDNHRLQVTLAPDFDSKYEM
jgi:hypothetical protein